MGIVMLVGLALLFMLGLASYNTLVDRKNRVEQARRTIDVQLVQRYDLIPKLVESVKQYMHHERALLEQIVRLRAEAMRGGTPEAKLRADAELSRALGQLSVSVENYPQLRASENFVHLQQSLNEIEEQIAAARRSYNAAVAEYNNAVEMFPASIIAGALSFGTMPSFVAEEHKRGDVDVRALFRA